MPALLSERSDDLSESSKTRLLPRLALLNPQSLSDSPKGHIRTEHRQPDISPGIRLLPPAMGVYVLLYCVLLAGFL